MARKAETLALLGGPRTVRLPWPEYPVIDYHEVNAATEVILSRVLSDTGRGKFVGGMEDAFAGYFGSKYCLSCGSGTAAIHAALFAVGVGPGAEVLTCAHNWISAVTAILHAGGTPVFCDTAPGAFHIDPEEIRRKATAHTRAVVVTHLWGIPADLDKVRKAAARLNLPVIEDVSHAHGAKYKGRFCGTIGDIGAFSLQGSKAIVAGEGGFLLTDNERYYQRATVPGHHTARLGEKMTLDEVKPFAPAGGMWTYRIHPVAAAIATEQLKKLPALNAARQANSDRIRRRLKGMGFLRWPKLARGSVRGWYSTPGFFDEKRAGIRRDTFVAACSAEGAGMGGEGYRDWTQIPLFQDMSLFGQMFVVRHANGVAFQPVAAGSLPNYEAVRSSMVLVQIPAVESPDLMDQYADAIRKVAGNLPALRRWQKAQAKKGK